MMGGGVVEIVDLYVSLAPDIRMVCYAVVGVLVIFQSAKNRVNKHWLASVIHGLTGVFMLLSFHFAWTRDPGIALYYTTPIVFFWAVACIYYAIRG